MNINIPDKNKINFARFEYSIPNKLLLSSEIKQRYNEEINDFELIKIFDRVWKQYLKQAIFNAELCNLDFVKSKISSKSSYFIDAEQEHRTFRMKESKLEFIAQLKHLDINELELTQLWFIKSTDIHPKCILICFETLDQRKQFEEIATMLNKKESHLGRQLLIDFINKFEDL